MCAASLTAGATDDVATRPFVKRLFSPASMARTGASAAWSEIRNSPHEWGRGATGFAKRFGSSFGRHVIKTTVMTGVGAVHHEDLHYHKSELEGTWPRMKYAVVSTFWVPRTKGSGHTLALGRISGNMSAGLVSRVWMPARVATVGAGVASGGISIGADVGLNVAREFWPRHKQ
jgi:hypothetical protein